MQALAEHPGQAPPIETTGAFGTFDPFEDTGDQTGLPDVVLPQQLSAEPVAAGPDGAARPQETAGPQTAPGRPAGAALEANGVTTQTIGAAIDRSYQPRAVDTMMIAPHDADRSPEHIEEITRLVAESVAANGIIAARRTVDSRMFPADDDAVPATEATWTAWDDMDGQLGDASKGQEREFELGAGERAMARAALNGIRRAAEAAGRMARAVGGREAPTH